MRLLRLTLVLCLLPIAVWAQQDTVQELRFAPGTYSGAVTETITGWQTRDFIVGAGAGQLMTVTLATRMNAYFGIMQPGGPGKNDVGVDYFETTTEVLPYSGNYMIRVYMRGDDADSGRSGPFTLTVTITD
jgi:hypothetical protein